MVVPGQGLAGRLKGVEVVDSGRWLATSRRRQVSRQVKVHHGGDVGATAGGRRGRGRRRRRRVGSGRAWNRHQT